MRLASESAVKVLEKDIYDPMLLEIISTQLNLPYPENVRSYYEGDGGPVSTKDLKVIYLMDKKDLMNKATFLGDIRVLQHLLQSEQPFPSIEYVRHLSVLMLLQQYGFELSMGHVISFVQRNLSNIAEYVLDSLGEEVEIPIDIIIDPIGKIDSDKLFIRIASRITPERLS